MGYKYYVNAKNSGYCAMAIESYSGKSFIIAIINLVKFKFKYPIVDFEIRNGYKDCGECTDCPHYKKVGE